MAVCVAQVSEITSLLFLRFIKDDYLWTKLPIKVCTRLWNTWRCETLPQLNKVLSRHGRPDEFIVLVVQHYVH